MAAPGAAAGGRAVARARGAGMRQPLVMGMHIRCRAQEPSRVQELENESSIGLLRNYGWQRVKSV